MSEQLLKAQEFGAVAPAMRVMASEDAPARTILCEDAGSFEVAHPTYPGQKTSYMHHSVHLVEPMIGHEFKQNAWGIMGLACCKTSR